MKTRSKTRAALLICLLLLQCGVVIFAAVAINHNPLARWLGVPLELASWWASVLGIASLLAASISVALALVMIVHAAALARKPLNFQPTTPRGLAPNRLIAAVKLLLLPVFTTYLFMVLAIGASEAFLMMGYLIFPTLVVIQLFQGMALIALVVYIIVVFLASSMYATAELLTLHRCQRLALKSCVMLIVLQFIPLADVISYCVVAASDRFQA